MTTLLALAERIEAADGPSRELDAEIIQAINPGSEWRPYAKGKKLLWLFAADGRTIQHGAAPRYTASLDAAVSLVPEGMAWGCDWSDYFDHRAWVSSGTWREYGESDHTRCLAICAAALRARAAQGESG